MRGSPSSLAELSFESSRAVLDVASAAVVGADEFFSLGEGGRIDGSAEGGECKYYEEDRDYEREVNSWCFQAHQLCCSSLTKYDKWGNFCYYYGFEDPGEQAEGIAGYNPWIFSTIDCTMCGDSKCYVDETNLLTMASSR